MRKGTWLCIGIVITGIVTLKVTDPQVRKGQEPDATTVAIDAQLPASLDKYFPPITEQSVYLFRMLGMNQPFTGIVVDLFEKDIDNARINYKKFRARYLEVSKLVPEWTGYFPVEPLDGLQTALEIGDQEKVMAAVQHVGKMCSDCHVSVMPMV
jgi:hypothetical protein